MTLIKQKWEIDSALIHALALLNSIEPDLDL
jgi:hypothetical protein